MISTLTSAKPRTLAKASTGAVTTKKPATSGDDAAAARYSNLLPERLFDFSGYGHPDALKKDQYKKLRAQNLPPHVIDTLAYQLIAEAKAKLERRRDKMKLPHISNLEKRAWGVFYDLKRTENRRAQEEAGKTISKFWADGEKEMTDRFLASAVEARKAFHARMGNVAEVDPEIEADRLKEILRDLVDATFDSEGKITIRNRLPDILAATELWFKRNPGVPVYATYLRKIIAEIVGDRETV